MMIIILVNCIVKLFGCFFIMFLNSDSGLIVIKLFLDTIVNKLRWRIVDEGCFVGKEFVLFYG